MQTTYTFHVSGMHCRSCILLTEGELVEYPGVTKAVSSLKTHSVTVTGDFSDKGVEQVMSEMSDMLKKHGYSLSLEKQAHAVDWSQFRIALPLALVLVGVFIGLQKMGFVDLVDTSTISYPTLFFVGVIASLSTCMAVVGGLVLSLSATFAKEGNTLQPQLLFHVGRLVSFFLLGGVIGSIGANFTLNTEATFILSFLVGAVMLILGINLLDVFPWAKRLQPSMPKFLSKHAIGVSRFNHTLTPLLVGIATFFLPCGFTQSMQIYSLTTGSFMGGALTMLVFALGTLPVLALLSFSSYRIERSSKKELFFKTAGLVVIFFALFNLINSFVIMGILPPIFTF
ncbi:MAG: sulfite exporter TauE/SafE family protein [Candidatus Moranbacteria bacterium]|nr:sulfite exporter TauE/SafE family protein [Candidatus Moranbacteria bacterium]